MTQAISCVASHGVSGVMFSPDGQRIAIMSSGYTLQLFDIESGAALWKHRGADVDIDVDFSADGARLSVGAGADKVRILDADDGRVMLRRRNPMGGPGTRLTAISPDGTRLAATYSSYVWVYDVISRAEMQSFRLDEICQILRYSPDGTRIVTLAEGGIQVWDAASGHLQSTLRAPANTNSMEFGGCSHVLVTAGEDSIIRVWDIASGTKTRQAARPRPVHRPADTRRRVWPGRLNRDRHAAGLGRDDRS
jgi:WD40 repeat protein